MTDPRKTFVDLARKDSVDVVVYLRASAGLAVRVPEMKCPDLIQQLRRATIATSDMVEAIFGTENDFHGHFKDVNPRARRTGGVETSHKRCPTRGRANVVIATAGYYRLLLIYNNCELFSHRRTTLTRSNWGLVIFEASYLDVFLSKKLERYMTVR